MTCCVSKMIKRENTWDHPIRHYIGICIVPPREDHDDVYPAINIRRRRRADLNAYARDEHKRCNDNARSPDFTTILYKSFGNTTHRGRSEANPCVYIMMLCKYKLVSGVHTHVDYGGGGGVQKTLGIFLLYVSI